MRMLILLGMLVAGAWFGPQAMESTDSPCAALEQKVAVLLKQEAAQLPAGVAADPRVAGVLGLVAGAAGMARGVLAEAYVRDRFPQLPPGPACVAGWWKLTVDPDLAQYLRGAVTR